jgi:hypothetical protein
MNLLVKNQVRKMQKEAGSNNKEDSKRKDRARTEIC